MKLARHLLAWWRLSRPEIWMVSVLPFYVGWVLASRDLVPHPLSIQHGVVALFTGKFGDAFAEAGFWFSHSWPVLLGLVIAGPLLWTATLLINDVHDLAGDRLNPRKARSPLVQGIVSSGWAHRGAYLFAALSLGLSLLLGLAFALCILLCLGLAWAYSVPPLRLKTRPGADLLVNAVGVGAIAGLAGWTVESGLAAAPWAFLPQGLVVAAAIYVPTTLVDLEADRKAGYQTLATHLGRRTAYRIGWWSWVACNLGALGLSALGLYIPRAMFLILLVFVPLLLYEYHVFIGRSKEGPDMVRGIVLCSLTLLAVMLVFALMYTGVWRP